jgi:ATP-dependent protease HslVU (ClpYQ) peptidase subunit
MTCIIALSTKGRMYMGCDSASPSGWDMRLTANKKVFKVGPFLIGYTSSFRMGQILQYHLSVRLQEDSEDEDRFMVTAFIPAVRECLKEHGYSKIDNNREAGGEFLVGYRGKIFHIFSDFQVGQSLDDIDACGCGFAYALGAMKVIDDKLPEDRIRKALNITAYFSNGVSAPFHVEVMNDH